ncbi:hypothetical protein D9M68_874830 [compost metagenome]
MINQPKLRSGLVVSPIAVKDSEISTPEPTPVMHRRMAKEAASPVIVESRFPALESRMPTTNSRRQLNRLEMKVMNRVVSAMPHISAEAM